MGDRGQILVKADEQDPGVYLYTHWEATKLYHTLAEALRKKWRWNDCSYLTRIIFDTMTKGQHDEETGFGIGTIPAGDAWRTIEVNVDEKTVKASDLGCTFTFEEFIQKF